MLILSNPEIFNDAINKVIEMKPSLLKIAAKESRLYFMEMFDSQKWDDGQWPDGAYVSNPMLWKTGVLRNELNQIDQTAQINGDAIEMSIDLPYAAAQNYGTTTAGRNNNVTIPKRQFMGESYELNKRVQKSLLENWPQDLKWD